MEPRLLRQKLTFAPLISSISAAAGVYFFHLPLWDGPMYGDDYLLVQGALQPNGNNGFLQDIWLAGGGKWRPANTPILLWLAKRWEFSYLPYQLLNLVLLVICASIVGLAVYYISKSLVACALSAFTISVSHFTWLAQISVYGVMEFSAAIFFVLACLCALKVFMASGRESSNQAVWILTSAALLLLSTLTHERYLFASIGFWLVFLIYSRSSPTKRVSPHVFMIIPIIHVFFKGIILGLNPLTGGGESSLKDVGGLWILKHLVDAFLGLFGYYSGSGKYYSDWPLGKLAEDSDLGFIGLTVTIIPLLLYLFAKLLMRYRSGFKTPATNSHSALLLFLVLFLTLLPAATVIQRIEFRWLFVPQILILLLFTSLVTHMGLPSRYKTPLMMFLPVCFVFLSLYYRHESEVFTLLRDQPSELVRTIEKIAPKQGDWFLEIIQSDSTMPTYWQLGYGGIFSQMTNPPYKIVSKSEECREANPLLPCISVSIDGSSTQFEIEIIN
jgi:hypothetical protein